MQNEIEINDFSDNKYMLIRFHFPLTLGILYLLRAWLRKWYMVEKWVSRAMRLAEDHSWTRQFSDFPDFVERSCIVPAFHCNAPWRLSNIIRLQVPEESDGARLKRIRFELTDSHSLAISLMVKCWIHSHVQKKWFHKFLALSNLQRASIHTDYRLYR